MKRAALLLVLIVAMSGVATAQTTFYFPQIADGTFAGGFFKTTIFVVNSASSGSSNVTMTFTTSTGDPFNVSFVDSDDQPVGSGNVVTIAGLAGGQSRKLISTAATPLTVGFATVTADASIVANAVFSQFSGTPAQGTLLSEAAVTSASAVSNQAIFVDESGNFRTALAYANPSSDDTGEHYVQPAVPQRRQCAGFDDHPSRAPRQAITRRFSSTSCLPPAVRQIRLRSGTSGRWRS